MHYLVGHLQANLRLIEEDRYCVDIIRQNQAVIAALRKVNELILQKHLDTCVTKAIRGNDKKERERVVNEIVHIFQNTTY